MKQTYCIMKKFIFKTNIFHNIYYYDYYYYFKSNTYKSYIHVGGPQHLHIMPSASTAQQGIGWFVETQQPILQRS